MGANVKIALNIILIIFIYNIILYIKFIYKFIKWIKLRIGFFEDLNEPLERKDLTSNGVYFSLNFSDSIFKKSVLNHSFTAISPNILIEQLESVN